jgi:hypothetical protein
MGETADHRPSHIPWYSHALVVASTSIVLGLIWDISWHTTIGRDAFWTPAHVAVYLGGVLAGVSCGYLVLRTTFAPSLRYDPASSVRVWRMRGPLGAWVAIWGAFAMITSAPYDDWWHNAYGLDVKILSPPHIVLVVGMMAIVLGALLLILVRQNRGEPGGRWWRAMLVYCSGLLTTLTALLLYQNLAVNRQHGSIFYFLCVAAFPPVLIALGRASHLRWPATAVAASYSGIMLFMGWLLQLFPATPKLAPVHNPVDHMVPIGFPLLLVVPALVLDLLLRNADRRSDWLTAAAMALSFVLLFFALQWTFSEFLLSPPSRNAFFMGGKTFSYAAVPGSWRHEYWDDHKHPVTLLTLLVALVLACVSTRLGLLCGKALRQVVR